MLFALARARRYYIIRQEISNQQEDKKKKLFVMPVVGALCTNTRELGVPPTMRRVQIIEESIRRFLYHGGEVVGMTVLPKRSCCPILCI